MKVVDAKPGVVRRAAVLACVAFAGCTALDHHECAEFPSIHGPCSWQHSVWQVAKMFAFSAITTAVAMAALLWMLGLIDSRKRP